LLIVTVVFLAAIVSPIVGGALVFLVFYGQWLVLLAMAWGILDAALHRDSVWRVADQNKLVWVIVQFIPLLGTIGYYILIHRTLLDAEDRLPRA